MRDRLLRFLPLIVLFVVLFWRGFDLAPSAWLRSAGFDFMQEMLPRPAGRSLAPVIIVEIDDESRRRVGAWPWPRTILARLTDRLREAGAAVVAYDMVFDAADRLSPARILPFWPQSAEVDALRAKIRDLPDHDILFADAVAASRGVIGFRPLRRATQRLPDLKGRFEAGEGAGAYVPNRPGALSNISLLEAAAAGNGALVWANPATTAVRRAPLLVRIRGQTYPTFPAEIVRVYLEAQTFTLIAAEGGASGILRRAGLTAIEIGNLRVPTDPAGNLRLHFERRDARRVVPAWQALRRSFAPANFENAIVIVTLSGEQAETAILRRTAFGRTLDDAEVHAQAVDQILSRAFLVRPDFAASVELGAVLVLGLLLIFIALRIRRLWLASALGVLVVLVPVAVAMYLFDAYRFLFDTIFPPLALGLVFAVALSQRITLRLWRRLQVKISFGRSLAPALVERLASGDQPIITDGETRTLTLLQADIRGFATLVGRRGPREALRLINQYLTPMSQVILSERGMIDKFLGDAVIAFWNAPLEDPDHARNACSAAMQIGQSLDRLNEERRRRTGRRKGQFIPVEANIGIVTDRFYVGEIGSTQLRRREYSVLGSGTNTATYLQSQAKYYGVTVLTDQATWEKVPDFAFLELDLILPPDALTPMRIYALVGGEERKNSDAFQELEEYHQGMLYAYRRRQWTTALDAARVCRDKSGAELAVFYELYSARIRAFQRQPPPENWNGVYRPNGEMAAAV